MDPMSCSSLFLDSTLESPPIAYSNTSTLSPYERTSDGRRLFRISSSFNRSRFSPAASLVKYMSNGGGNAPIVFEYFLSPFTRNILYRKATSCGPSHNANKIFSISDYRMSRSIMFISSLSFSPSIYRKSTASSCVVCRAKAIISPCCVLENASTHSLLCVERNS